MNSLTRVFEIMSQHRRQRGTKSISSGEDLYKVETMFSSSSCSIILSFTKPLRFTASIPRRIMQNATYGRMKHFNVKQGSLQRLQPVAAIEHSLCRSECQFSASLIRRGKREIFPKGVCKLSSSKRLAVAVGVTTLEVYQREAGKQKGTLNRTEEVNSTCGLQQAVHSQSPSQH